MRDRRKNFLRRKCLLGRGFGSFCHRLKRPFANSPLDYRCLERLSLIFCLPEQLVSHLRFTHLCRPTRQKLENLTFNRF